MGSSFEHGYYFNHRAGLWDGIVHIPMIIQVPEFQQKILFKEQVGLMDLTPTVLSLQVFRWTKISVAEI